ncbi:MAG: redoxin domain-containing protein [Deltaproteobacteria bacterium]|nr:redoxin domain-containing protein [Deltaproteobacteria bacterium]MBW2661309.1 redoxin domain-containing protein [Deltaproteobacteria bacterium]
MKQIKFVYGLCITVCILIGFSVNQASGAEAIVCGIKLPEFTLDVSDSAKTRQYLGFKDIKNCNLSQIPAKLVIIELYSLYCTVCQKQAPKANKIYKCIQQDPDLSMDIKMIGIGIGNNQKEVIAYKMQFRVPFPLFIDPKFEIHKKFGEPRTPYTILASNSGKVLYTCYGEIKDIDDFLSQIRKFYKQQ